VGAIGSDVKAVKLKQNLRDLQISEEKIKSLFCPIGEDFGNNTPEEISISITAQLLRVRSSLLDQEKIDPMLRESQSLAEV
jgi:xanthine dehydrogenase accessory factor